MQLTPARRNLGIVASTLGILQGLAWASMSLACIVMHNWAPTIRIEDATTFGKLLEALLYNHFLAGTTTSTQFIIRPFDFTVFMWIYFLLSVGWFAVSVDQLAAIHTDRKRKTTLMVAWAISTLIVSLIDLIFACLLGRDYAACNIENHPYCFLTIGVAMSIAARGYTLWFINVMFAIFMIYIAVQIYKQDNKFALLTADHSIPRVRIPKTPESQNSVNSVSSFFEEEEVEERKRRPYYTNSDPPTIPSFLSRGDRFSY